MPDGAMNTFPAGVFRRSPLVCDSVGATPRYEVTLTGIRWSPQILRLTESLAASFIASLFSVVVAAKVPSVVAICIDNFAGVRVSPEIILRPWSVASWLNAFVKTPAGFVRVDTVAPAPLPGARVARPEARPRSFFVQKRIEEAFNSFIYHFAEEEHGVSALLREQCARNGGSTSSDSAGGYRLRLKPERIAVAQRARFCVKICVDPSVQAYWIALGISASDRVVVAEVVVVRSARSGPHWQADTQHHEQKNETQRAIQQSNQSA